MLVCGCVVGATIVRLLPFNTLYYKLQLLRYATAVKFFLLGNPIVYWSSFVSLGVFSMLVVWYLIRWQRGYDELKPHEIDQLHYAGLYPLIGWFLHYIPFVAMARVTYLHHYFPALYFAILCFGFCVDWFMLRRGVVRNEKVQWAVYAVLYLVVIGMFLVFRDISFGMVGPSSKWKHLKWLSTWRITD